MRASRLKGTIVCKQGLIFHAWLTSAPATEQNCSLPVQVSAVKGAGKKKLAQSAQQAQVSQSVGWPCTCMFAPMAAADAVLPFSVAFCLAPPD